MAILAVTNFHLWINSTGRKDPIILIFALDKKLISYAHRTHVLAAKSDYSNKVFSPS